MSTDRASSDSYIIETASRGLSKNSTKDGFRFEYIQVDGDFDAIVSLNSFRNYDYDSRVALMLREDLTESSRYAATVCRNPENAEIIDQYDFVGRRRRIGLSYNH